MNPLAIILALIISPFFTLYLLGFLQRSGGAKIRVADYFGLNVLVNGIIIATILLGLI